jgi:hypothetical protein
MWTHLDGPCTSLYGAVERHTKDGHHLSGEMLCPRFVAHTIVPCIPDKFLVEIELSCKREFDNLGSTHDGSWVGMLFEDLVA